MRQIDIIKIANEKKVPKTTIDKDWVLGHLLNAFYSFNDNRANFIFKGGTCAALLDYLDRFSVDLDFDLKPDADQKTVKIELEKIFSKLSLHIRDASLKVPQYILKYDAPANKRNTLQFDAVDKALSVDAYKPMYLSDLERYVTCQTIETMFAHKLVAVTDRYNKHNTIAGRDIYDIHYFFTGGYSYNKDIIRARTGKKAAEYLAELSSFIQQHVTDIILREDLNTLLPYSKFNTIRSSLKQNTIRAIKDELARS